MAAWSTAILPPTPHPPPHYHQHQYTHTTLFSPFHTTHALLSPADELFQAELKKYDDLVMEVRRRTGLCRGPHIADPCMPSLHETKWQARPVGSRPPCVPPSPRQRCRCMDSPPYARYACPHCKLRQVDIGAPTRPPSESGTQHKHTHTKPNPTQINPLQVDNNVSKSAQLLDVVAASQATFRRAYGYAEWRRACEVGARRRGVCCRSCLALSMWAALPARASRAVDLPRIPANLAPSTASCLPTTPTTPTTPHRCCPGTLQNAAAGIKASARTYKELRDNLGEGLRFYMGLQARRGGGGRGGGRRRRQPRASLNLPAVAPAPSLPCPAPAPSIFAGALPTPGASDHCLLPCPPWPRCRRPSAPCASRPATTA